MLEITHKKRECIGCALCADVAPNYWFMDKEGLSMLHTVQKTAGPLLITEGFDEDLEDLEEAERSCPVQIIKIKKK